MSHSELITNRDSLSFTTTSTTRSHDKVYDRERHANCLLELYKHTRLEGQQLDKILSATNEMEREIQAGFARINSRLHNIEAYEKNEDACLDRVDYAPFLKADGTAIANFLRNGEPVEDLDSISINISHRCPL